MPLIRIPVFLVLTENRFDEISAEERGKARQDEDGQHIAQGEPKCHAPEDRKPGTAQDVAERKPQRDAQQRRESLREPRKRRPDPAEHTQRKKADDDCGHRNQPAAFGKVKNGSFVLSVYKMPFSQRRLSHTSCTST